MKHKHHARAARRKIGYRPELKRDPNVVMLTRQQIIYIGPRGRMLNHGMTGHVHAVMFGPRAPLGVASISLDGIPGFLHRVNYADLYFPNCDN